MKRESKFETRHLKQSKREMGEETTFKCLFIKMVRPFRDINSPLMHVGPKADELQLLTIIGLSLDMVGR